jgi:hypothetical protein
MRHEHLVVTVESGLKDRIDDDLDAGETVEAWVADAIERKLAADEDERRDPLRAADEATATEREPTRRDGDGESKSWRDGERGRRARDGDREASNDGNEALEPSDGDDYDEGFEYVDDCSI